MHTAPADFALGGEAFAVIGGDVAGLPERLGDLFLIAFRVLEPVAGARRRVDTDDAVWPHAEFAQLLRDATTLLHLLNELLPLGFRAYRRPAPRRRPYRGDDRPDHEIA